METFLDSEHDGRFQLMERGEPLVSLARIYDRDDRDDSNNNSNMIPQWKKIEVNRKLIIHYNNYVGQEIHNYFIDTLVNGAGGPQCFSVHRTCCNSANALKYIFNNNLQLEYKFEDNDMEELIRECMRSCNDETTRNSVLVVEYEVRLVYKILDRGDVARISKLVREEFRGVGDAGSEDVGEGRGSTICAICLDEFAQGIEVVHTPCAHLFHVPCLSTWLGKDEENGCPMCRASI